VALAEPGRHSVSAWAHRCWIFPRDPAFAEKAGRVLDLYEGRWKGKRLTPDDCILATDEKTSIQARSPSHPTLRTAVGRPMRVEHEYKRLGAWAYRAAWDARRAKTHGRCERKTGIVSFERLVDQVMSQQPYRSAERVFWIMDDGSSHRGAPCAARLAYRWPRIIHVHTPVHVGGWIFSRFITWKTGCLASRKRTNKQPNRSTGSSAAATSPGSRPKSVTAKPTNLPMQRSWIGHRR
jgi:hypothetical protein